MKRSVDEVLSTKDEEQQINKKRNLFPSSSLISFSTLDALSLYNIFTFIDNDDLFTQLALYGTCVKVMLFVRSEKTLPLNGVLQLKKFIDENPNVCKISLHYRMCGLLHQFAWLNSITPIDDCCLELPHELLEYCTSGLIEARYAKSDEFFGGGFTCLEVAVKKVNSNDKIRLQFTKLETLHGRGFVDVGTLSVSIDDTVVYNGEGITDLKKVEELTKNAEICKNMNGIELLNLLFGVSMNEKKPYKENIWQDTPILTMKFDTNDESIIDNFITELVDLNNRNICSLILTLISKTENLCKIKEKKKETKRKESEMFEFISLVKNNINCMSYDEYTYYTRQYIVCKLKRKDNGELVDISVTSIMGPSYSGTYAELSISLNGEPALTFNMEEGTLEDEIVDVNFEELVEF